MTIKTNFDDGLMDILKKMDAELVSIEVKGERLVKKFDRDDHTLDDIEDFFEDFDGVDARVEYIGDERCFICEVTTEGKDEGIVLITDEKTVGETTSDKVIIPPTVERSDNPSDIALKLRALRAERIAQGLCAGCGKRPPETTLIEGRPSRYCRQCQEQKRDTRDKQRLGLISTSTEEKTIEDSTPFKQLEIVTDATTKKSLNDYAKERIAKLKAEGICISCGKRKATKNNYGKQSVYCSVCRKRKNNMQKLRKKQSQKEHLL